LVIKSVVTEVEKAIVTWEGHETFLRSKGFPDHLGERELDDTDKQKSHSVYCFLYCLDRGNSLKGTLKAIFSFLPPRSITVLVC
jgi:hypothetical protein